MSGLDSYRKFSELLNVANTILRKNKIMTLLTVTAQFTTISPWSYLRQSLFNRRGPFLDWRGKSSSLQL